LYKIIALIGLSTGMILSVIFHGSVLTLTYFTLPFLTKKPIDVPPLISVELIQISDTTNIPYAPKAAKIIDKVKKKNEKLLSEQAPPKKIKKEEIKETKLDKKKDTLKKDSIKKVNLDKKKDTLKKDSIKKVNLDKQKDDIEQSKSKKTPTPENKQEIMKKENLEAIPMPDQKKEKKIVEEEKEQQPSKEKQKNLVKEEKKLKPEKQLKDDKIIKELAETKKPIKEEEKVIQASEFEKKELFDANKIKGLIAKQYKEVGQVKKKTKGITQSEDPSMLEVSKLTVSQEFAIKSQYIACWTVPVGMALNDDFLLRVKLNLKKTGEIKKIEVLNPERMAVDKFFKAFAESVLRAVHLCNPIKNLPSATYDKWKVMVLKFNPIEMQGG